MINPTFSQRFFASSWPDRIWFGGWVTVCAVAGLLMALPLVMGTIDWQGILLFLFIFLVSGILGFFLASFPGIFIYGPLMYSIGIDNGGPFGVGDRVQIIGGQYAGHQGLVYSDWQGDGVRVDCGESAKEDLSDIFGATQLLLVEREQGVRPEEPSASRST